MRRFPTLLSLSVLAALIIGGLAYTPAQSQDRTTVSAPLSDSPGYVDLSSVGDWFDGEASTQVDIQGPLVNLVAESSKSNNTAFSRIMGDVTAIQVRGYPTPASATDHVAKQTRAFTAALEKDGWRRVVYVRDQGDEVSVYIQERDGTIAGLTMLSMQPGDESVFVNIVGSLSPDQIGQLGQGLNLSSLQQVDVSTNTP